MTLAQSCVVVATLDVVTGAMAGSNADEEAQQLRVKNMQALLKWSAAQETSDAGLSLRIACMHMCLACTRVTCSR